MPSATRAASIPSIQTNAQAALVDRLDIALQGTSFGVDFNPAADALRVISDNCMVTFVTRPGLTQFVTQDDLFLRNWVRPKPLLGRESVPLPIPITT